MGVLRTKVVNLQLEKQKCEVAINELENYLIVANEKIIKLTTDNDEKINVIDIHQKRIYKLEEEIKTLTDKLDKIQPSTKKIYTELLKIKKENKMLKENQISTTKNTTTDKNTK